METISGTFYRVDGDYSVNGLTAKDVIEYEAFELGNSDAKQGLAQCTIDLSQIPASCLLWVTRTKEQALRYARDEDGEDVTDLELVDEYVTEYKVVDGIILIPDDGDGGLLILML